jgi:ubiquinone/menaquinone biosynthesis C-methylase UbiE
MESGDLKRTYELGVIHDRWEDIYRSNPIQDRFNSLIHDRVIAELNVPQAGVLLDAGCGVGYHTVAFARRGVRSVGIDISETILEQARQNAVASETASVTSFRNESLEALSFADCSFDGIHCRGVLMHIPRWQAAVAELCRVLKPGGRIAVMENSRASVEQVAVTFLRKVRPSQARLVDTPGGVEAWSDENGEPFVVRTANISALVEEMARHGVEVRRRWPMEFWGIGRFPAGIARNSAIRFNRAYFTLGLPTSLSMGQCLIGEKRS